MSGEDPYRHPGGRTCAVAMALLVGWAAVVAGFWTGVYWAVTH